MYVKAPVVGVVGYKNSGKTTVIESIVQELAKRGYRVATAKHIPQKGFSIDTEGKDTWRHSDAGANPVVSVSDVETAVLIKNGEPQFSLDQLFMFTPEIDVIVLEGFSRMVLDDENVGKILCVRNREEYDDFRRKTRAKIIAFCSTRPMGRTILRIKKDSQTLLGRILRYIRKQRKILIIINDLEVPIQPFVSEIIRKSVLGMISSLKGVSIRGNEEIRIKITS